MMYPNKHPLNPFDFYSYLLCSHSNQVIHMVIYPDFPVDTNILIQAVSNATRIEPRTRCRIIRSDNMLWWEENSDLNEKDFFVKISSITPENLLHEALSCKIDPHRDPLIQVVQIESETSDNNDILVLNVHHVTMDGRGIKEFAGLILSQYQAILSGMTDNLTPDIKERRDLPLVSSLVSPFNQEIIEPETAISWVSDFSVPVQSFVDERLSYSVLSMSRERMEIIHRTRKEWKVTFNDLMLSAIAKSFSEISGKNVDQIISLLHTIDLRRYLDEIPVNSITNYSTAFKVDIPVSYQSSLKETTLMVSHYMDSVKSKTPGLDGVYEAERFFELGPDLATIELYNRFLENKKSGRQIPLFTNTGIIPHYNRYPETAVCNAYILPSHSASPTFLMAISTYLDQVTISSTYYEPAFDRRLIEEIFTRIDRTIPGCLDYPGVYRTI